MLHVKIIFFSLPCLKNKNMKLKTTALLIAISFISITVKPQAWITQNAFQTFTGFYFKDLTVLDSNHVLGLADTPIPSGNLIVGPLTAVKHGLLMVSFL